MMGGIRQSNRSAENEAIATHGRQYLTLMMVGTYGTTQSHLFSVRSKPDSTTHNTMPLLALAPAAVDASWLPPECEFVCQVVGYRFMLGRRRKLGETGSRGNPEGRHV